MTEFLAANWLWIALIGAMIFMHRRGHGCGMHGHRHDQTSAPEPEQAHHAAGETNASRTRDS